MNKVIMRFDPDIFDVYGMAYTIPNNASKADILLEMECHKSNLGSMLNKMEDGICKLIDILKYSDSFIYPNVFEYPHLEPGMRISFKYDNLFKDMVLYGEVISVDKYNICVTLTNPNPASQPTNRTQNA